MTTPTVTVEPLRWWHLPQVHAIEEVLFPGDCWSVEQFWSELAQPTRCYVVATDADEVVGYAGLFLLPPDADIQTVAVRQDRQGQGIARRLVSDLLHLSRVEAEERVRPTAAVDLAALLKATLATLRPMAEAAGVTLELEAGEGAVMLPADADQLTQVFANLVENAVKYGGAGGVVTLRLSPDRLPQGPAVRPTW